MIFESSEIAAERERLGLSRDELSRLSGVPFTRIGKIEREGNGAERTLKRLTVALQRAGGAE